MNKSEALQQRRPIDWQEVHRRIQRLQAAVEQGWAPDEAERQRILADRARKLAEPPVQEAPGEMLEVLEFKLGEERYGIETLFVREVVPLSELACLPGTPAFVLGIVNVRGEIISAVDLKTFFDLPRTGLSDLNKLIVLESLDMTFGILVDEVGASRLLPAADLQAGLPTLVDRRRDYLKGIAAGRLVILDGARLLADPRMVVRQVVED